MCGWRTARGDRGGSGDGGRDTLGDRSVDRADGCIGGGLPEATELMGAKKVTVVETLQPLPLLLSVSAEAGWRMQIDWR